MRHALLSLLVFCGVGAMSGCHNPVTDALHRIEHKVFYHPVPPATESYPPDGAMQPQPGTKVPGAPKPA